MKNSLLLLAGAAALSLASCSQEKTTETTTTATTAAPADATATDAVYQTRGNRMADKFAADMKIADEATRAKLRTAYYNRSKRYDMMHSKYQSDTTGMAAAMSQYNTETDAEFQSVLTDPTQYKTYQSSRSTYDEASNMDNTESGAASSGSMASDSSMSSSASGSTSSSTDNGSAMSNSDNSGAMSGAGVEKSKSKMSDGSKVKVKEDGTVKMKGADGTKSKM